MTLHSPFCITSRLMPGVRVPGNGSLTEISIEFAGETSDHRARYRYHLDGPDGFTYTGTDLKSGVGGGSLQEGMVSLLSFLSAAGEAYAYRMRTAGRMSEDSNETLFPAPVVEWAYQNSDEITMLALEIEESETVLIED